MTDDLTRPTEAPQAATPAEPSEPIPSGTQQVPPPEPAEPVPAGTQPVVAGGAAGASRLRWAVGLGVAGLAVAVAIGAFLVLSSRPAPEALKYIPAGSAVVVEIRPDLPGDQVQKLGTLLAHFPGFLDQTTLPDKLDETFSRLVGDASKNGINYRTDIKPWLSGPAFIALRPTAGASATDLGSFRNGVASLTTTGAVGCDTPFRGKTLTHETYKGLTLSLTPDGTACVVDGRQALLGDTQSVHDAIDAHAAGSGMDRSAAYEKARSALKDDQLMTVFIDGSAFRSLSANVLEKMSPAPSMLPGSFPAMTPTFPEWAIEGVRAEDDALVIDAYTGAPLAATASATPGVSLLPLPAAHASELTPFAPANTLVYLEGQGAGVTLQNLLTGLSSDPQLAPALQMLNGAGGAGQLVSWIQDAGIIVVNGTDGPTGGLLLVATDEQAAKDRVSQLTGLLALAGLGGSGGIQTHDSTISGVSVTTVTITDVSSLVPPSQLPSGVSIPAGTKIEFSIAAKGRVLLLGTGEPFMTAVLGVQPGSGLVDQAAYKRATARALAGSRATVYVDVRDTLTLAEKAIPADALARWQTDLKPYVAPFEAVSLTSSDDGTGTHSRLTLSVNKP